ncbi:NAD(P)-binding protein [Durotheca rogersii]|uniref:NAD(P)-binding protein n=1 Tax=Durotheca rogersii TaxID=419775 RepID=UPI00221EB3CA|nr:NAD(P)-binding protein [Durotheca rogersii]KAI5860858.1 NAD(P)-binding protein [Durotheca rogersii]
MASAKAFVGKVILVTGAAQGIGEAVVRYTAARGAAVSFSDVAADTLEATRQSVAAAFPAARLLARVVDTRSSESVERWVAESKQTFGRIDGCVNSAGILGPQGTVDGELTEEAWGRVIGVNLTGAFLCLKHEVRAIEDGGSIVNLSSGAGLRGIPGLAAYSASKHGLIGLTKSVASEVAPRRIRVNAVCPSLVETPMGAQVTAQSGGTLTPENLPQLFRWAVSATEVAALVAYLLADESKFLTSTSYPIDGGFAA